MPRSFDNISERTFPHHNEEKWDLMGLDLHWYVSQGRRGSSRDFTSACQAVSEGRSIRGTAGRVTSGFFTFLWKHHYSDMAAVVDGYRPSCYTCYMGIRKMKKQFLWIRNVMNKRFSIFSLWTYLFINAMTTIHNVLIRSYRSKAGILLFCRILKNCYEWCRKRGWGWGGVAQPLPHPLITTYS